jgi:periplasmic protein TonB
MLFSPPARRTRRETWTFASSVATHALVIALLFVAWSRVPIVRTVSPGEKSGSMTTVLYAPSTGSSPHSQTGHAAVAPITQARLTAPKTQAQVAASPAAPDIPAPAAAPGLDSLGEGDVRIALSSFFPRPKPDLHGLPHGFEGDVVVDVVIDEAGHIREAKLVRGISPQVDNTVIATVEQWQFVPAERNGTPIASLQELLFHYGPVS